MERREKGRESSVSSRIHKTMTDARAIG